MIGRKGYGLKRYTAEDGAMFIWFDKHTSTVRIWGFAPCADRTLGNVMDVDYHLREVIAYQTKRRYAVALKRLHRSSEKHHAYVISDADADAAAADATSGKYTYTPSDFPALLPTPGH